VTLSLSKIAEKDTPAISIYVLTSSFFFFVSRLPASSLNLNLKYIVLY
jgi:hypothetical protein